MSNDYFWRENSNKSFLVEFEFSRQNKEKNYNEIIQVFWRENSNSSFVWSLNFRAKISPFPEFLLSFITRSIKTKKASACIQCMSEESKDCMFVCRRS